MKKAVIASIVTFVATVLICNAATNNHVYRVAYNAIDGAIYELSGHTAMLPQY